MKKVLILSLLLIISACTSSQTLPEDTMSEVMNETTQLSSLPEPTEILNTEMVSYYAAKGDVQGYLAYPNINESRTYPAVVLIHEWWGFNDDMKALAEKFAHQGYVALAIDLYEGEKTDDPERARELSSQVRENVNEAFTHLTAAVDFLKAHPRVQSDRLAAVGWCFGGQWSYEMAANDMGVNASVIYYGRFNPEDDLSMMRAQILGHFGEDDVSISVDDVREFQATLKGLSEDHEIYIYPNAGHGFAGESSSNYEPDSAEQAWQRTVNFLEMHL